MEENWNLDIDSYPKTLNTLDGVTLSEMDLPPIKYVIKDLLPQGLAMLNGSMKIGKSWMVLDWCVRIAKGENIWNFPTTKGTTLYLSLEDSNTRLQDRLLSVTEEVPPNVYFSIRCLTIGNGLEEQIRNFVAEHPDTVLVAIDIFQKIRTTTEINYGVDYSEIEILKSLAGELGIAILLVHHVRKKEDDDPFNMPSGSNGLAGCADTLFVLKKSKRCSADATLFCTGRDIEYREIDVRFEKETCTWHFISDSAENPETLLPRPMQKLVEMMKEESAFSGSNAEFMEEFKSYTGIEIHTKLTLTEYVTQCILGKQIFVIDGLDEVIRQQKAIGKNINRLTVLSNMGKISSVNLQELTEEYAALNKTLTEMLDRKRWSA